MTFTLKQAKQLKYGDVLLDQFNKRWKVSGQVKRWKTNDHRIYIPLKHGLYAYDSLTESDFIGEDDNAICNYIKGKE